MQNKRGQDIGINSAILIVIAIVVLGIIVAGTFMGWENLTAWIQPDTVSITAQKCSTSCGTNSVTDFCTSPKSFKASRATVRAITSEEAFETYNLSYENEKKLFQSKRIEYLNKEFAYEIYNESEGEQVYHDPNKYNPDAKNTINISEFLKKREVSNPEKYLSPLDLVKLIPRSGEEGYLKSEVVFPKLFALDPQNKPSSIKIKSESEEDLRDALVELAKLPVTQDYITAARNYMYYEQVKSKDNSFTGIKVTEFSCAALSEHPVWKESFNQCNGDNLICEGKTGLNKPTLEEYAN